MCTPADKKRVPFGLQILLLAVLAFPAAATSITAPNGMTFRSYSVCPGSSCPEPVLAEGVITSETPERFRVFAATLSYTPTIEFNSPGGNLAAALALGELIRAGGFDTAVYMQAESDSLDGETRVEYSEGRCLSSCAYAFMGGVGRKVGHDRVIGVHQFYGSDGDSGEQATQLALTVVANHIDRMGVSRRTLDIASITPRGGMTMINRADARSLNLDNSEPPLTPWALETDQSGGLRLRVVQQVPYSDRRTSLALLSGGRNKLILVFAFQAWRPQHTDETKKVLQSATLFGLCFDSQSPCVDLKPVENWEAHGDILMATFELDASVLWRQLQNAAIVRFETDIPGYAQALSPTTRLSVEGLKPGLLALFRQD